MAWCRKIRNWSCLSLWRDQTNSILERIQTVFARGCQSKSHIATNRIILKYTYVRSIDHLIEEPHHRRCFASWLVVAGVGMPTFATNYNTLAHFACETSKTPYLTFNHDHRTLNSTLHNQITLQLPTLHPNFCNLTRPSPRIYQRMKCALAPLNCKQNGDMHTIIRCIIKQVLSLN